MIHYHGGPITPDTCAMKAWKGRHAFTGAWKDAVDWVLKEACKAVSMLESSREHEVISQQEKA
ncbi:hypothetical protein AIG23_21385 [Salmonella enterica subsp. enterica serovar Newport]|nr:hypothetical protein [Salmonella enterica subsp. enterica serovar Newport]ECZ7850882.1 hypothetical protein [Salmonella enterica subsp. enterica serovar Newport]EEN8197389.1 hypothetical protein [Salmonella enterica subsp. enterica serovar Newport]